MSITLTNPNTAASLTLPDALNWVDEFAWSPVQQSKAYTTTGALLIEEGTRQAGRPITLEGKVDATWATRADLALLHTWAATPGLQLTLRLRGVDHAVAFDHEKGALQGVPVMFYADAAVADADWYVPTLRFIQL